MREEENTEDSIQKTEENPIKVRRPDETEATEVVLLR
jgi:hypothetical protein